MDRSANPENPWPSPWHRPWTRHAAAILAIGLLVGLVGPFGTFAAMALPQRLLYWIVIAALSWVQWGLLSGWLTRWTGWPEAAVGSLACIPLAALLVVEVYALQWLLGRAGPGSPAVLFLWIAGTALLLFWLNHGLIHWILTIHRRGRAGAPIAAPSARFLSRIPARIAGNLLCVKTEDHYLRIYTSGGEDLILMRLRDALGELEGLDGLQVHRSYWVARAAVAEVARDGRKTRLRLSNGLEVPVSESRLPGLREAGWLG